MAIVFTDVTKCREIQRNHFRSNMENYSVTGLFRGNRALVQKNMKMELRLLIRINKLKENANEKQFKKYTQVHLVKIAYTRWSTEQKERIRIHALPQEEKSVHAGKPRFWSEVFWVQGIGPRYFF